MNRRALKTASSRHDQVMAELADIADAIEAIAGNGLKADVEGRLRNADEMVMTLLARVETAEAQLTAQTCAREFLVEERQSLQAQIIDQAQRADIAESELVEARLELAKAEITIRDLRALSAKRHVEAVDLARENESLSAEVRSLVTHVSALKAELVATRVAKPAPIAKLASKAAPQTVGGTNLTPLAEQICMLIGKGHNDTSIRTIVNNYLAPEDWLNAGGVKAMRAMLQVANA